MSGTLGAWKRHVVTLTPSESVAAPFLAIGVIGPGTVRIDEVRMFQASTLEPQLDARVAPKLRELGITAPRYPGGTLTDTFVWRESVGDFHTRGEIMGEFNRWQTPALGLDEFLRLCEELDIEPLLQVNIREPAAAISDLVEYVNGPTGTRHGVTASLALATLRRCGR